jgi:hypothetical protein
MEEVMRHTSFYDALSRFLCAFAATLAAIVSLGSVLALFASASLRDDSYLATLARPSVAPSHAEDVRKAAEVAVPKRDRARAPPAT